MANKNDKPGIDNKKAAFFSSLHFKIILTFTVLVAVITLSTGIVLIYQTQNHLQKAILQKNHAEAENLKNEINSLLSDYIETVETLTYLSDFKEMDPFAINEILRGLIKEHREFQSAAILNSEGIEYISTRPLEKNRDLSEEPIFRRALNKTYISDVYYSKDKIPLINIAVPIIDYGNINQRLGVLVVELKLTSLWPPVDTLDKTAQTVIAITDKKGNLIYHTDKNRVYEKENISSAPVVDKALDGESGSSRFRQVSGQLSAYEVTYPGFASYLINLIFRKDTSDLFYTYVPLGEPLKGAIIIQQNAAYALSDILYMQRQSFYLMLVSIFLALVIGSSTAKKLSTPLNKLMEGTRVVGSGNLNYRIDIKSKDEIGLLADSFNKMTQDLLIQRQKAITDGLTGLYTHSHFERVLEAEVDRAIRYKTQLSLLLLDIDFFKSFNDNYGHQVGDIVLKEIADIFTAGLRKSDTSARYGGEEFAIIAPGTDANSIKILAERIRKKVANDVVIEHEGQKLHVTVSIGVTTLTEADRENNIFPGDFFRRVDTALYQAKENGRNQVVEL